jgi:hypothetical protein
VPPDSSRESRDAVARAAADALDACRDLPRALVGFDGFVDFIVHMVDRRTDMSIRGYTRLRTISDFAARCASAAGKSTNIEQVLVEERFGGNGPLLASALAGLGLPVTFVGAIARTTPDLSDRSDAETDPDDDDSNIHPIFRDLARRCDRVIPIGTPSWTDCLEFEDGKLMFNNTGDVQAITWDRLLGVVGLEQLRSLVAESSLVGIVNWSLLGGVPGIWRGLCRDVFPTLRTTPHPGQRHIFIDLSDPAKRSDEDILRCVDDLRLVNSFIPVTLGLNLAEAERLARVLSLPVLRNAPFNIEGSLVRDAAARIREASGLACVVVHPRHGAAADDRRSSAWFEGPYTSSPRLSTGAGDHFNAGFAVGRTLGLPVDQCLATGCALGGVYVRDAASPSLARLTAFLRRLPASD